MEVKDWSYEEFPEFTEQVKDVAVIETTGDEWGIRYINDVEYAEIDGVALHLQILLPGSRNEPEPVLPCFVFVQGSAWMKQFVHMQIPMIANLAKKGYVVACVEYRHSEIATFPAQAMDANNAVRFLRMHADDYHIDSENIIMAGDSSGGHTALFSEIIRDDESADNLYPGISAKVKGIVDFYGCVNFMEEDANPTTINHHLPDSPEGMVMGGVVVSYYPSCLELFCCPIIQIHY